MSTQVSSLQTGGVKRVLRGVYGNWNSNGLGGGEITIPSVNMDKTVVNLLSSVYSHATDRNTSDTVGGYADTVRIELKNETTLHVRNLVEMYIGGGAPYFKRDYVNVSWELIEYV